MPIYNKKSFLLPDSINSVACYHGKIDETGIYKFTIHDCKSGIRLVGNLNDKQKRREAPEKFRTLAKACLEFADFIENNYLTF